MTLRIILASLCVLLFLPRGEAGEFGQSGDMRWIVYTIRDNPEEAIAFARSYDSQAHPARVMETAEKRYAVVAGPHAVPSPDEFMKTQLPKWVYVGKGKGKEASLSNGDNFVAQTWTAPKSPVLARGELEAESFEKTSEKKKVIARSGDLEVELEGTPAQGDGDSTTVATLRVGGREALTLRFGEGEGYAPNGEAQIVRLDIDSPMPQVVVTHYTGGFHCCYETKIATSDRDGRWRVIDAGLLDSSSFHFEDLDADGAAELIGKDDRFLYAFGSYANSRPPTRINKIAGGELKDVTENPTYARFLRQQALLMEARASDEDWRDMSFLAGWVAAKSTFGEGREAWSRMLRSYDREVCASVMVCKQRVSPEQCPQDKQTWRDVPFPAALKDHFAKLGYVIPGVVNAARSTRSSRERNK